MLRFLDLAGLDRIALGNGRQNLFLVLGIPVLEGRPAGLDVHPALGAPLPAGAVHVYARLLEAVRGQELPDVAPADEGVDLGIALGEILRRHGRGDDGVVGLDLGGVPARAFARRIGKLGHLLHAGPGAGCRQHLRGLGKLLEGEKIAVCSGVGGVLGLVEGLAGSEHRGGAHAVLGRGLLLDVR